MNDDAKLQKVSLGPDWIDLSFGEPKVVNQALYRQINRFGDPFQMPKTQDLLTWEYQPAAGKPDLIEILEEKFDAKVVVTNGAKQGLAAAMCAFRRQGNSNIYFSRPFYPANPSLAEHVGLNVCSEFSEAESFLATSPNNPDGAVIKSQAICEMMARGPTIHDAAYYNDIYLPKDELTMPLGHIQLHSMSKSYGLSGLRIGYVVVQDERYYKDIVNYIEMTTAGVSAPSQDIARNIELFFQEYPAYYKSFMKDDREAIAASRRELEQLDPDVLKLVPCDSNSMFGWFEAGPALNTQAAKVHILPGSLFGQPGMMRMNIAHPIVTIREAVERLNKHKI